MKRLFIALALFISLILGDVCTISAMRRSSDPIGDRIDEIEQSYDSDEADDGDFELSSSDSDEGVKGHSMWLRPHGRFHRENELLGGEVDDYGMVKEHPYSVLEFDARVQKKSNYAFSGSRWDFSKRLLLESWFKEYKSYLLAFVGLGVAGFLVPNYVFESSIFTSVAASIVGSLSLPFVFCTYRGIKDYFARKWRYYKRYNQKRNEAKHSYSLFNWINLPEESDDDDDDGRRDGDESSHTVIDTLDEEDDVESESSDSGSSESSDADDEESSEYDSMSDEL